MKIARVAIVSLAIALCLPVCLFTGAIPFEDICW